MRAICTLSLLSALLLSTQGFAAETPAAAPAKLPATPVATTAAVKLNAKDSRTETFQAKVLEINLKDRLVTLRNQDGESIQLAAGDGVRNLEQLRVGDQVTVHATKSAVLQLKENKGVALTFVGRKFSLAPEGVKPGAMFEREVSFVADVLAVDNNAGIITLKGVSDHIAILSMKDPAKLAGLKAGDQVEGFYSESLEIAVAEAPAATATN